MATPRTSTTPAGTKRKTSAIRDLRAQAVLMEAAEPDGVWAWMTFTSDRFNYMDRNPPWPDHPTYPYRKGVEVDPTVHEVKIGTNISSVVRASIATPCVTPRLDHLACAIRHDATGGPRAVCDWNSVPEATLAGYPYTTRPTEFDSKRHCVSRGPAAADECPNRPSNGIDQFGPERLLASDSYVPGCTGSTLVHLLRVRMDRRPLGSFGLMYDTQTSPVRLANIPSDDFSASQERDLAPCTGYIMTCASLAAVPELHGAFYNRDYTNLCTSPRAEWQAQVMCANRGHPWLEEMNLGVSATLCSDESTCFVDNRLVDPYQENSDCEVYSPWWN